MSIDKVIALYPGFHFEGELRALNRTAAGITEGVIVAIGSYKGQMDCALALHAQVPVYAIDSRESGPEEEFVFGDEDRAEWMQNVLAIGVAHKIRPISLRSADAAYAWQRMDERIGLLFIDGSHDYESVHEDLALWLYYVLPGGLVALHDNNKPGVMQALDEFEYCLELVEVADLTNVYRLVKPYREIPTLAEEVERTGMPLANERGEHIGYDTEHVAVKARPQHPSQKSKTPARKGSKSR